MSEQLLAPLPDPVAVIPFPSLAALRAAHSKLLDAHRTQAESAEFWQAVIDFLHRGRQAGTLLDREEERWAAQSLLDYWTATAYSLGRTMPDATLAEFDPALAPELPAEHCPYMGLAAFQEGREHYFFGRERLVGVLVNKVAAARLVAVVGPSGSGKSSLVLAGLIPALKAGALAADATTPSSAAWHYTARFVPGSDPLANLAAVLPPKITDPAVELTLASQLRLAAEDLRRDATYLLDLLTTLAEPRSGTPTPGEDKAPSPFVLVIDQFEELFTLCTDDGARTAFIDNLLTLIQAPQVRHTVILTMRADFESFVARLPQLLPHFEAGLVRVTPMNAAELRAVIEKPAEQVGLKFESGVVDALVQDVLGEPAALPLLQFTLLKLWEARDRNRITWETYKRLGGGRQALARSADRLYESLIPEDQVTARRILLRLVRPSEGLEVTSNRVRQQTLYLTGEAHDRVDRVLYKLVDADLLRLTPGERPTDTQVEVAHEALVRNWPRLVGWLEDERERIRERLRITEAAEQWLKLGRDPGALLRGAMLEAALRYTDLNELEQAYVRASQTALVAAENEKEQMRQRELAQALALAAEQERLAKSERQWAAFQTQTAATLQRRLVLLAITSLIALFLAAAAFFFYSQAVARRGEAETQATVAATAQSHAEAQATVAEQSRQEAVAQAATAQAAELYAQTEAAAARTAEADLRAKQAQLSHLAAALSYTGEQLDELERIIGSARATLAWAPTITTDDDDDDEPTATPSAPLVPAATPTPMALQPYPPAVIDRGPLTESTAIITLAPRITTTALAVARGDEPALNPVTPTATGDQAALPILTRAPLTNIMAIVPEIAINLYAEPSEKAAVLGSLRAPAVLTVLQATAYWVQVATADGTVGWVEAYWLTYRGDTAQLPRELRYRAVAEVTPDPMTQTGNQLPFVYGVVIAAEGAEAYPLLDDPQNPNSQLTLAPVGTAVTLLFTAEGPPTDGSGLWYYVQLADPGGQNILWQGYLPAAVVAPR
ncbi:MAG: SH3 domain-containing protein [Caldilineaceae bacterium]|nr:SH3 domain-containing protein [Caldilineaceae bacterium]